MAFLTLLNALNRGKRVKVCVYYEYKQVLITLCVIAWFSCIFKILYYW